MIKIDQKLCIGCESCVKDCLTGSLTIKNDKATYQGPCLNCGHCVAICPENAISIPEFDMADVEEIKDLAKPFSIDSFLGAVKSRRSTRQFLPQKVKQTELENLVQAGRYTPTAVNLQNNHFIIIQEKLPELKELVWQDLLKAFEQGVKEAQPLEKVVTLYKAKQIDYLFRNAPAVLYIATDNLWDAGLAAQNIELAAISQNLGVLHNGFLARATRLSEQTKKWLQLKDQPLATSMILGYPAVKYKRTAPKKKANITWL